MFRLFPTLPFTIPRTDWAMPASGAHIDGDYRYKLWRTPEPQNVLKRITWVMLNPSTADALVDDNTIRKCMKFSRTWGYGRMMVVNLFAYRSTDPKVLKTVDDPVGPRNNDILATEFAGADLIVAAWGNHGSLFGRDREVFKLLDGRPLMCLKVNEQTGQPAHPLYQRDDTVLSPWTPR